MEEPPTNIPMRHDYDQQRIVQMDVEEFNLPNDVKLPAQIHCDQLSIIGSNYNINPQDFQTSPEI